MNARIYMNKKDTIEAVKIVEVKGLATESPEKN